MRIFRTILYLIIIGSFGYSAYIFLKPPCSSPIRYTIGEFDQKFGMSQTDFVAAMGQAEKIWEDSVGKNLFEYDAAGDTGYSIFGRKDVPVNLVYDARQATADKHKV